MIVNVTLNVTKPNRVKVIDLRQGEQNSTVLHIVVEDNGARVNLREYTRVMFCAKKSDGCVLDDCAVGDDGAAEYVVPAAMTTKAETIELAYVALYKGDEWLATTQCMTFDVARSAESGGEVESTYVPAFVELRDLLTAIVAEANTQKAGQQASWEAQTKRQEDEFQAAERGRSELSGAATDRANVAAERAEDAAKEIEDGLASGAYQTSVTVGRADELPPWSAPTVEDSGTGRDAVLDFGIPGTPDFEFQAETLPPGSPATMRADREEATGKVVVRAGIPEGKPGVEGAALTLDPGYFHMAVDGNGHLILTHNDNEPAPPLSIRDGRLVYTIS